MKPAVVLPTYNEAENIRKMIEAVLAADPVTTAVIGIPATVWRVAGRIRERTAAQESYPREGDGSK